MAPSKQQNNKIIIIVAVILIIVAIDRATKLLVTAKMSLGESIPSGDSFFAIFYTRNDGVAFSLLEGGSSRWILVGIQSLLVIAIVIVVGVSVKRGARLLTLFTLALMLGGGIGNLIDRIAYGSVVDFVSVGSFPVFNFADSCLTVGCAILIVYLIFFQSRADKDEEA
jgi:signal peptidase II